MVDSVKYLLAFAGGMPIFIGMTGTLMKLVCTFAVVPIHRQ